MFQPVRDQGPEIAQMVLPGKTPVVAMPIPGGKKTKRKERRDTDIGEGGPDFPSPPFPGSGRIFFCFFGLTGCYRVCRDRFIFPWQEGKKFPKNPVDIFREEPVPVEFDPGPKANPADNIFTEDCKPGSNTKPPVDIPDKAGG